MSYECSHCGKKYQRNTHFRRHEATHLSSQSFTCPYCRKCFARRDVCRKHATSCTSRGPKQPQGIAEIRMVKRGNKSRACDACSRSKLSCDFERPCGRCKARHVACTYVKAMEDPSNSTSLDPLKAHSGDQRQAKLTIPFILEITNPKNDSMLNSLRKEDIGEDTDLDAQPDLFDLNLPDDTTFQMPFFWSFTQLLTEDGWPESQFYESREVTTSPGDSDSHLDQRLAFLTSELRSTHESLCHVPFYDGTFDEDVARAVFTTRNAKTFISTYFRLNHPSFPLTHKPSFDFETCAPELMLALMLNGSARLLPQDDAISAVKFYRVSEAYIFRRLEQVVAASKKNELPSREVVDILTAAMAIYGIISASNQTRMRNVVTAQRLPLIVSIVRYFGLNKLRHPKPIHETEWTDFVRLESCIRIATFTAFSAWFDAGSQNAPSALVVAEMKCDLLSPLAIWDAKDANEFQAILKAPNTIIPPSSTISECYDALLKDSWVGTSDFPRSPATLHDLLFLIFGELEIPPKRTAQLIILALVNTVVSARQMSMLSTMAPSLLRAVTRWFKIWEVTIANLDPQVLHRSGLPRHSDSIAWLTRGFIEISIVPGEQCDYWQNIGQASMKELHGLVQALRNR